MDEKTENKESSGLVKERKSLFPFIAIGVVLLLGVGVGAYFLGKKSSPEEMTEARPAIGQRNPPSLKGQNLADTRFANSAVQIYPGPVGSSAAATMSGWNLKTTTLTNGSIQASLIPVGSEATEGDTAHTFVLKPGDKLYFNDLNPGDDTPGGGPDNNKNDDMGIIVDANGIIQ